MSLSKYSDFVYYYNCHCQQPENKSGKALEVLLNNNHMSCMSCGKTIPNCSMNDMIMFFSITQSIYCDYECSNVAMPTYVANLH